MSDDQSFLHHQAALGFGPYGPEDELLHPAAKNDIQHDALTETQYFGFSVPEARIHGFSYLWHHPNLGTLSSGVAAWQGIKPHHLAAELYDFRMFMSEQTIAAGIDHYKTDVGYQVDVIEPFKLIRIRYEDASRGNALDISYTALTPPAMLPNRKHFEQTMKTKGFLSLRGKRYEVDGYNVRDRSWGEARREEPTPFPPIAWLTGVFGEDFSFNCTLTDHPRRSPEWLGLYQVPDEQVLKGGWIYRNGEHKRVVEGIKLTRRDPLSLCPLSHELELVDQDGERLRITGTVESSSPSGFWPNVSIHIGLVRWQCENRVGWGDSQECQWTDFVHRMNSRR
ncbi:MAG: hypothetical protein JWQ90_3961 [Hydrocarboniphaga sp.]|uniref:DUF7064 domain-containing protein n=1 Tax=Hydrocarboniphaga sp. TaxID=2033016 RepID=UPI0026261F91|nr:hypothetical protein [Hydrocarboniphaga sp.]MDB5971511.1 hypothetical protein [Hydrocarboniphaga sp.]